jgi:hypothetical protein
MKACTCNLRSERWSGQWASRLAIAEMTRATLIVGGEFDATLIVEEAMVTAR